MPVIICLILLLLMLLAAGGYVFYAACARGKEYPWFDEEGLQKTAYGRFYHQVIASDSFLKKYGAVEVMIRSFDGFQLCGIWLPAKNPRGTVLFAHGYHSTPLVDFGLAFEFYHNNDMNLLIPSQRCHGKSEGKYITFGVLESRDMLSWIDYHNRTYGDFPIVLSGMSMGASTMMYLADEPLPGNVKGIVADCGYTSPYAIIGKVVRDTIRVPADFLLWIAECYARVLAKFSLKQKDTRITLSKNRLPILMVHGLDDDFVPCQMTLEGYEACSGEKQLLLVEGAGHGVSFLVDRVRYGVTLRNFLASCLGGKFTASKEEYDG